MIYYYASIAHEIYSIYKGDFISNDSPCYRPKRKKLKGWQKNRK